MLVIGFLIEHLGEEDRNFATRVFEYSGTVFSVEIAFPRKGCRAYEPRISIPALLYSLLKLPD